MLDSMRKPFLIVALIAIFLAVLVELGSLAFLGQSSPAATALGVSTTGKAIPALAFLDGLVFYATLIITMALLIPERVQSKIQGIVTLVFSILLLLGCIVVIFKNIALLILMVSLLMSPPFGTAAYFLIWGSFDINSARVALSLLMTLKLVFAICLVLAHQRFLQNKGLLLIIVTSLVSNLIIAFLQGFLPNPLVNPLDVLAALIVLILGGVWGVVYLVGGAVSVVKVVV